MDQIADERFENMIGLLKNMKKEKHSKKWLICMG